MNNKRAMLIAEINAHRTKAGHAELTPAQTQDKSLNHLRVWLHQASQGLH